MVDRPFPGEGLTGGEGGGVWEVYRTRAHLRVVLGRGEGLGGGGSTEQGGSAAEANDGDVAPVRIGRGEVVWELHGVEAQLMVGSIEDGEGRRSGFDGEQRRWSSGYGGGARGRGGSSRNWSTGSSSLAARG